MNNSTNLAESIRKTELLNTEFNCKLLVPHFLLAAILLLLLVLSFIHYHIKYRRKQSHAQYQEYMQLASINQGVRRVSIPVNKVMRRFSLGYTLGKPVLGDESMEYTAEKPVLGDESGVHTIAKPALSENVTGYMTEKTLCNDNDNEEEISNKIQYSFAANGTQLFELDNALVHNESKHCICNNLLSHSKNYSCPTNMDQHIHSHKYSCPSVDIINSHHYHCHNQIHSDSENCQVNNLNNSHLDTSHYNGLHNGSLMPDPGKASLHNDQLIEMTNINQPNILNDYLSDIELKMTNLAKDIDNKMHNDALVKRESCVSLSGSRNVSFYFSDDSHEMAGTTYNVELV